MAFTKKILNEKNDSSQTAFIFLAGADLVGGNVVVYHTDGYCLMPAGTGPAVGWIAESVSAGQKVKVYTGTPELPCESDVTIADIGSTVYVTSTGTVTTSSSGNVEVGKVVAVERSGWAFVKVKFPL